MIYLILAICSSALISIFMRAGENMIRNNISTLAVNYVVCLLLGMYYSAGSGSFIVPWDTGKVTIFLGVIEGFLFVASFILYQFNIFRNGVVMSSTFMKLGVLIPTLVAILIFGEHPSIIQILGIVMAVLAIIIVNGVKGKTDETGTVTAPHALALLLLCGGLGDSLTKFYDELGPAEYSSHFLLYVFAVALVLCTTVALAKGQRFTVPDILFGCLIGFPNYYSARFLLLSLSHVPAVIAYPMLSVGTILLVSIAGVMLFHEKMTHRQWASVGVVIAAMILLNV